VLRALRHQLHTVRDNLASLLKHSLADTGKSILWRFDNAHGFVNDGLCIVTTNCVRDCQTGLDRTFDRVGGRSLIAASRLGP
jgi:hypothetical protein